jgi:hypothetical protein
MTVYLSSPGSQIQADYCRDQPVLISYGVYRSASWIDKYVPSFSHLLVDSGAFSVLNSGKPICVDEFAEWANKYPHADAVASLDSISGNWEEGMRNWEKYQDHFPTFHDTDPWEALDAILAKNPVWIGLGMKPPRTSDTWLDEALERIPDGVHVHGWALRAFTDRARLDSFDSTNWFRDSWKITAEFPWLTPGEALEIVIKRYERETRLVRNSEVANQCLFNTQ